MVSLFGLEKFQIKFMEGVDFRGPIDGRRYTHLDFSGDLFLSVGFEFDRKAI